MNMGLASTPKVVLGCIGFLLFWILAVFPAVPFLPIGRTAGSLLGAMLMVVFQVLSPDQAYAAIDLPILGLLFGTMVVSVYLERADMFKYLGQLLSWRSRGGRDLLCRVSFLTAIASAFFTNDTCCVVLTEFVLKLCRQHNLPPQPFLLALASSANIGSSATPIGNPQNLVIAVQSKISFGDFVLGILPSMVVGVVVNTLILLVFYWKLLSSEKDEEAVVQVGVSEEDVNSHRFSPATLSHMGSPDLSNDGLTLSEIDHSEILHERKIGHIDSQRLESTVTEVRDECAGSEERYEGISSRRSLKANNHVISIANNAREIPLPDVFAGKEVLWDKWKSIAWKTCVYLVTIGMLVALICGLNMSWTAITAAISLVVLDFTDARPSLEKVSYPLLVFFSGMFVTVDGFNKTGIPSALWDAVEPHARIDNVLGLVTLSVVVVALSNLASNVPTGQILGLPPPVPYLDPEANGKHILTGVNFASGGSGILPSTGYKYIGRIPFDRQIEYFSNTKADLISLMERAENASHLISNALFYINIGSYDYISNYFLSQSKVSQLYSVEQYQELLLGRFTEQLKNLYELGARNFLISNLGPLGCTPLLISSKNPDNGSCVGYINSIISKFNVGLENMLKNKLQIQFTDAQFVLSDNFAMLTQVIDNPTAYGFKYANESCCGIGRLRAEFPCTPISRLCFHRADYVFWDAFHTSDALNSMVANVQYAGPPDFVRPVNLKELMSLS